MDLEFYVRVRTCEKRVTGKQPLHMSYMALKSIFTVLESCIAIFSSLQGINTSPESRGWF